jgi:CoA:oxalate CoA-transferase
MLNANKKSVSINLKNKDGKEVFRKLVTSADVLIENFRPGVMDKLGLGATAIRKLNPRIIFCSISGFGKNSPIEHYPAWDNIIQGISGLMSLSGTEESGPMRVGTPMVDCITALTSAFAVASAIRQRDKTDQGQTIDVAMFDSILTMMCIAFGEYIYEGRIPRLNGNKPITKTPFAGCFQTKDGQLVVAANTQKQTELLTRILGCADLLEDPRTLEAWRHPEINERISRVLNRTFMNKTAAEWEKELTDGGIPAGKVRDVAEVTEHPNTKARNVFLDMDVSYLGQKIKIPNCGFKFDHGGPSAESEPPSMGADTRTVLKDLGYTQHEISRLAADKAIEMGKSKVN